MRPRDKGAAKRRFHGPVRVFPGRKAFYSPWEALTIAAAGCQRVLKAYAAFTRARHINNF